MKYVTVADFGEYSVIEPINGKNRISRREEERIKKRQERESTLSAYLAAFLSVILPIGFIALWIVCGY